MAVTKRLRYEIFRRDNNTCRYCGASAPDVKIQVDHLTPKALGGTDEVTNLVTACEPCNSGKSATPPGAPLVADVKADALRHAELTQAAYAVLVERIGLRNDYEGQFVEAYGYQPTEGWHETLGRWHRMGIPIEIITDAAETASRKKGLPNRFDRFKYFCGIVWNQVAAVDAVTADKAMLDGHFHTSEAIDEHGYQSYRQGFETGRRLGWAEAVLYYQDSSEYSYEGLTAADYERAWRHIADHLQSGTVDA